MQGDRCDLTWLRPDRCSWDQDWLSGCVPQGENPRPSHSWSAPHHCQRGTLWRHDTKTNHVISRSKLQFQYAEPEHRITVISPYTLFVVSKELSCKLNVSCSEDESQDKFHFWKSLFLALRQFVMLRYLLAWPFQCGAYITRFSQQILLNRFQIRRTCWTLKTISYVSPFLLWSSTSGYFSPA